MEKGVEIVQARAYSRFFPLHPDCHADRMDGFCNPIGSSQVYLLGIDIGSEQPIPHGKPHPEIRPRLPHPLEMVHSVVARRDEKPLQPSGLPSHVHMHPVIGEDQHVGIERKE